MDELALMNTIADLENAYDDLAEEKDARIHRLEFTLAAERMVKMFWRDEYERLRKELDANQGMAQRQS